MRNFINVFFALFFAVGFITGQEVFSLDEAKDYALKHTEAMKLARLGLEDADAQISEYWASGTPTLTGRAAVTRYIDLPVSLVPGEFFGGAPGTFIPLRFGTTHNVNAGLDANALLFSGSFFKGLKAQKIYKELTMKQVDVAVDTILANVTKAYMTVLIVKENITFTEKNLAVLQKSLEEVKRSLEAGFVEQLDVDRLQLSFQTLRNQLIQFQSQEILTKNLLKFQMGYPIRQEIVLSDKLNELTAESKTIKIDMNETINFSGLPQYAVIEKGEELNRINVSVLKAGYLPTLTANATHQEVLGRNKLFDSNELGWFPATFIGLNLNVPIFDGLDRKAKIQRAKIELEKVTLQKTQFERAVEIQVANAKVQVGNARNMVLLNESTVELAQNIYDTAQRKYRAGVGSSIELSQTEQDLYNAQSQYINSLYDLVIAVTDLKTALGEIR